MTDDASGAAAAAARQLADHVVQAVKAAGKAARALQAPHVTCRVTADLLVVLAGARPAVLLDYCPGLTASQALALTASMNTGLPTALKCGVMSLDGCQLIFNLSETSRYLAALLNPSLALSGVVPHLVAFRSGSAGLQPVVMTQQEGQAVFNQLAGLLAALTPHTTGQLHPPPSGGAQQQVPHVSLDQLPGLPLMPTLFGILLGYPVVYVVEGGQQGAQKVSHCLSLTQSTQIKLIAALPGHVVAGLPWEEDSALPGGQAGKKKKGRVFSGTVGNQARDAQVPAGAHVISSFTLPSHLMPDGWHPDDLTGCDATDRKEAAGLAGCVQGWVRSTQRRLQQLDSSWGTCKLLAAPVEPGLSVTL